MVASIRRVASSSRFSPKPILRRYGLLGSRLGDLSHRLHLVLVGIPRHLEEGRLIVAYASLKGRLFRLRG